MSDQSVFITPQDVWMFRDSKPFSAGQNFYMQSQFPPNPQVTYGVTRTHYLEANGIRFEDYNSGRAKDVEKIIGTATSAGDLRVTGPFVARQNPVGSIERFFPQPLDVLKGHVMRPLKSVTGAANMPDWWRPLGLAQGEQSDMSKAKDDLWLSESEFERYLNGQAFETTPQKDLFGFDDRVGLALDPKRRKNEEGKFYRAKFVRPCEKVGLLLTLNLEVFGESGTVGIGGESRMGHYQVVKTAFNDKDAQGRVKVVLLTPAYFSGGWHPQKHDWSHWLGDKAKLVSYAIGKPLSISGWNVATGKPKPLRHFLPAGSVFYFEDATWQKQPFTESAADAPYPVMGFGAAAVTTWDYL